VPREWVVVVASKKGLQKYLNALRKMHFFRASQGK